LITNKVSQVKTKETDGYEAYQIAYGPKRENLLTRPAKAHLKKANISEALTRLNEVRVSGVSLENLGKAVSYNIFKPNTYIDVTGITKGKGFQGVMKRFNFAGGPAAHGSKTHRRTGSVGNRATPARVYPRKKMPGHMGDEVQTVQNVKVQELNLEKGYLLIRGSVPGAKNGFVKIAKSVKK
jgi:large subunit ribosomal protein L3